MFAYNFDLKEFAKQANLLNTINGGIVNTRFNVMHGDNEAVINVNAPTVEGESYDVVINNNLLFIYSTVRNTGEDAQAIVRREDEPPMIIPLFNRIVEIPPFVEAEQIHAELSDNQLKVHLPFKSGARAQARRINIRRI